MIRVLQHKEEEPTRTIKEILLYLLNIVTVMLGVLVSFQYNWPDYVHTDYGFPLVWATHTTVTIAGPVDIWNVNISSLLLNVVCWLSISFISYLGYLWIRTGRTKTNE